MLLVGFSRGGTHLMWCFLASHEALTSREIEVNQLGSKVRLGLQRKIFLETASLLNSGAYSVKVANPCIVDKAVCSWPRDFMFKILRRHDPMKYIKTMGFEDSYRIFLVKNPADQISSWMRRGCSFERAVDSYLYHLRNWQKNIVTYGNAEVVSYDNFCLDPVGVTEAIWNNVGLDPRAGSSKIKWAPKAHGGDQSLPTSDSGQRQWIFTDKDELARSLGQRHSEIDLKVPDAVVDAYANFVEK